MRKYAIFVSVASILVLFWSWNSRYLSSSQLSSTVRTIRTLPSVVRHGTGCTGNHDLSIFQNRSIHHTKPNFCPAPGTSIDQVKVAAFTLGGNSSSYNSPYIVMNSKLMLCWIPKNSCTKFKQIALRAYGESKWRENKFTHQGHPDLEAGKFPNQVLRSILQDPEWKRVVVLRDPVERFISGYMDKIVNQCWFKKSNAGQCYTSSTEDFEKFLTGRQVWEHSDHFAPQNNYCGLRDYWWVWTDFIYYDAETVEQASKAALMPHMDARMFIDGERSLWEGKTDHQTSKTDTRSLLVQAICSNQTLFDLIMQQLKTDYEFFRLPPPTICY